MMNEANAKSGKIVTGPEAIAMVSGYNFKKPVKFLKIGNAVVTNNQAVVCAKERNRQNVFQGLKPLKNPYPMPPDSEEEDGIKTTLQK